MENDPLLNDTQMTDTELQTKSKDGGQGDNNSNSPKEDVVNNSNEDQNITEDDQ